MASSPDVSEPARRPWFSLRVVLGLAVVALLVFVFAGGATPPRLAWGMRTSLASTPPGHHAYIVHSGSVFGDLRIVLSKRRLTYVPVPPNGGPATTWPRLTGRRRTPPTGKIGDEEIEFRAP